MKLSSCFTLRFWYLRLFQVFVQRDSYVKSVENLEDGIRVWDLWWIRGLFSWELQFINKLTSRIFRVESLSRGDIFDGKYLALTSLFILKLLFWESFKLCLISGRVRPLWRLLFAVSIRQSLSFFNKLFESKIKDIPTWIKQCHKLEKWYSLSPCLECL